MSQAIAYATGIALSPLPVAIALVLLSGPRPRAATVAFLAGTTVGTTVAAVVLVAVVAVLGVTDAPGTVDGARVALGTLLVALGLSFVVWRRRLRTVRVLDRAAAASPPRAATLGVVLPLVNVKNLSLMIAAAVEVVVGGNAVAGAAVVIAVSLSLVVAVTAVGLAAPGAAGALGEVRRRLSVREVEIAAAVCLILGAKLLVDGL